MTVVGFDGSVVPVVAAEVERAVVVAAAAAAVAGVEEVEEGRMG